MARNAVVITQHTKIKQAKKKKPESIYEAVTLSSLQI